MTTCTMIVDCGMLGEQELTVHYEYSKGFKGNRIEPEERESAYIWFIKFGGDNGIEVELPDDFIKDEVIPYCIADYHGENEYAQERFAEDFREQRRAA